MTAAGYQVWCLDSPGFGGSEHDLLRVIDFTPEVRRVVAHAPGADPQLLAGLATRGVPTELLPGGAGVRSVARAAPAAARLIARHWGARWVVWCHTLDSNRWLQVGLAAAGRRVLTVHRSVPGSADVFRRSRLSRPVVRLVGQTTGRLVFNGHGQARLFSRVCRTPPSRAVVIPNSRPVREIADRAAGLRAARRQLRAELGLPAGPVVVAVGRLSEEKDQGTLVRAAGLLPAGATVVLVGDGPRRAAWQAEADPMRVRFVGHQPDPVPWLAAADVYVLPSLLEGLSGGLIEALAAGLPCVATDIAGNRELVTDGATGLSVPAGDPPALAAAVGRLLADPALAARLAAAGQARVAAHYDEATERVAWRRLLADGGGQRCRG